MSSIIYDNLNKIRLQLVNSSPELLLSSLRNSGNEDLLSLDFRTSFDSIINWLYSQIKRDAIVSEFIDEKTFFKKLDTFVRSSSFSLSEVEYDFKSIILSIIDQVDVLLNDYQVEIFVYGTLMSNECNNSLLRNSKFLGSDIAENVCIYDLGTHPALSFSNGIVFGERYRVALGTLQVLDRLEGHPFYYVRQWIKLRSGHQSLAYIGNIKNIESYPKVLSGKWKSSFKDMLVQPNLNADFISSSTYELLSLLRTSNVQLIYDGNKLTCRAPKDTLNKDLFAKIERCKDEIISFISKVSDDAVDQ